MDLYIDGRNPNKCIKKKRKDFQNIWFKSLAYQHHIESMSYQIVILLHLTGEKKIRKAKTSLGSFSSLHENPTATYLSLLTSNNFRSLALPVNLLCPLSKEALDFLM
ncbi:hypothetical protein CIPAW_06G033700 [Carya illinoinensis]|uniref:Uncharacterized protein n=1 Tax=Carya illinoinensis TaxID=32201 RepID=A0A8T1Q7E2_CARIL|nr:hypothetical protein CIPAW_06G033700 [Carya illinoinensis]